MKLEIPNVFSVNTIEVEGEFGIVCNDKGTILINKTKEESKAEFNNMREKYMAMGGSWPNSFALMQLSFPMKAIDIAQEELTGLLSPPLNFKRVSNVSGSRAYVVAEKSMFEKYLTDAISL